MILIDQSAHVLQLLTSTSDKLFVVALFIVVAVFIVVAFFFFFILALLF